VYVARKAALRLLFSSPILTGSTTSEPTTCRAFPAGFSLFTPPFRRFYRPTLACNEVIVHLRVLEHDREDQPQQLPTELAEKLQIPQGDAATPQSLVSWAVSRFGSRLVVTTGFGMEGCVLIDMLWRLGLPLTVHYLDTHFFFPETHALRLRLEARYPGIAIVNAGTDLTPEEQAAAIGPELWKTAPDRCCNIRKVEPMQRLLAGAQAWMTGLRRSQSDTRADTAFVEQDTRFGVFKINPLAGWSRENVWDYAVANGVPYNELHEQGYPTIGCTHCTRPVPGSTVIDYSRAGRWAGIDKTECGLHWNSPGAGI